jgi:hypothetical protein
MASPQDRAWSEGHKAGSHDQPLSSCPYGSGMMQQKCIKAGVKVRKPRIRKATNDLLNREIKMSKR